MTAAANTVKLSEFGLQSMLFFSPGSEPEPHSCALVCLIEWDVLCVAHFVVKFQAGILNAEVSLYL